MYGKQEMSHMRKLIGLIIVTLLALLFWFWASNRNLTWNYTTDKPQIWISLVDAQNNDPISEVINISVFPPLNLIASPGTNGDGPFLYSLSFSTPAIVTLSASGYRRTILTFLKPGYSLMIPVNMKH